MGYQLGRERQFYWKGWARFFFFFLKCCYTINKDTFGHLISIKYVYFGMYCKFGVYDLEHINVSHTQSILLSLTL